MTATITEATEVIAPPEVPVVRQLPWSGLVSGSAEQGESLTSGELIHRAGMDWEVGIRPLWRRMSNGEFVQAKGVRETYRSDDESYLGVVKSHYKTFSNLEVFRFGDVLVEGGQGRWTDAGMQRNGNRVFMTMLLKEFNVLGNDPYQLYAFFRASHDGSTGLNAWLVPFRVSCTNQQGMVSTSNLGRWTILHTGKIAERVAEAQRSLVQAVNYEDEFRALTERLAATEVSDDKVQSILARVVPEGRAKRDDMLADMLSVYKNSPTIEQGNAYAVLNAVTEYYGHVHQWRNPNSRFHAAMLGEGAQARKQVLEDLAALN